MSGRRKEDHTPLLSDWGGGKENINGGGITLLETTSITAISEVEFRVREGNMTSISKTPAKRIASTKSRPRGGCTLEKTGEHSKR